MEPALEGRHHIVHINTSVLTPFPSLDHYKRILNRLERGRALLSILQHQTPQPYDVPDVVMNMELYNREPPLMTDS
jgi:hypothetical protein